MSIKDSTPAEPITIVGGGPQKVLYTLKTVARIGLLNSVKALNSKNACKACGMGGQRGGMTNEKDEFPSVCNKSIQAQSTDIQQPIPTDLFNHTLDDFKQLSAYSTYTIIGIKKGCTGLTPSTAFFKPPLSLKPRFIWGAIYGNYGNAIIDTEPTGS